MRESQPKVRLRKKQDRWLPAGGTREGSMEEMAFGLSIKT